MISPVEAVPVTTGDMLNGRSSIDMTKVFPQNSFRVIWMAAMMPHTVLMGTENTARSNVIFTCMTRPQIRKAAGLINDQL